MRDFQISSQFFVLFLCQFRRNGFLPLGIQECDIFEIDLLAFFCGRIGAGNIKITALHKIIIAVAAAGLSARYPRWQTRLLGERHGLILRPGRG